MKPELSAILPNLQGVRLFVKNEGETVPDVVNTPRVALDPREPSLALFFRFKTSIMWVNLKQDVNPFNKISFNKNGRVQSFNDELRQVIMPPAERGGKCTIHLGTIALSTGQGWALEKYDRNEVVMNIPSGIVDSVYTMKGNRPPTLVPRIPANVFTVSNLVTSSGLPASVRIAAYILSIPKACVFDPTNVGKESYPFIETRNFKQLIYSYKTQQFLTSKQNSDWLPIDIPHMEVNPQGFDPSLFREFFKKEVTF